MESSETKIKFVSLSHVAKRTGYTPEHLNALARKGILQAQKIGRNWFVSEQNLQAFEAWINSPNHPKPGRKKNSEEASIQILTPDQVESKIIPTIQPVPAAPAESIKTTPVLAQTFKPAEFKSPIFKERLIRFALIFVFFWSASVGLAYLLAHGQTKVATQKQPATILSENLIFNPQTFVTNYQEKVGEVLSALNIPRDNLSFEFNQQYFPDNSQTSEIFSANNSPQSAEPKIAGAEKTTTLIPPLSPDAWKFLFLAGLALLTVSLICWFFYSIHKVFLQPVGAFGWIVIIIFFLASSFTLNQFIRQNYLESELNTIELNNPLASNSNSKPNSKNGVQISGGQQTQEAFITASEFDARLLDYVLKDSLQKNQTLAPIPLEFRNQDFEWKNQEINLAKDSVDSREIARHAIEAEDIDTGSITSRTIRNHTIQGEDIDPNTDITLNALNVATFIDLGTNTIADGNFVGDWDFNGGDLTTTGNITTGTLNVGATTLSGNLDMQNNIIQNIGNASTDFTATGGLNLAGDLDVNGLVNDIAGTLNLSGNALTASGLLTITPALGLTINTPGQTVTLATQNFDVNATGTVTIDGTNFTYTPTGTYTVSPGSTYTVDATGTVSIDSDASATLSGAGVNLTSDGANAITLTYAAAGGTFELTDGTTRLEVADNGDVVLGDDGATTIIDGSLITLSGNTLITGTITETLTDNSADALDIQEGTNNYININTTNNAEAMQFGNAFTNPNFSFLGTGLTTLNGGLNVVGNGTLGTNSANTLAINSVIASDVIPEGNLRDFGSSSNRWEYGYFTNIDATNISGVIVTGSTAANSWTINSDNLTDNKEIASLIFKTGTPSPIDAVLQWNAANNDDGSKIIGFDNYNLFNFPIGIYSKVNGANQTFTSGSLFKFSQPASDAITQSGAFIGANIDFSSNLTVPNNASGNQTGFLATLKDGGAGATAIGFQTAGTLDYGLDLGGAIGTADIRLSNLETISNLVDGTILLTAPTIETSGDLTISGDDLFMGTNTANYFLMADGTNYNPTTPAAAITGLGLDAGGLGDIWVERAGDTMTGTLTFSGVATDIASVNNEHIAIMPNGTGNVGIGTTAPAALLDVAGNAVVDLFGPNNVQRALSFRHGIPDGSNMGIVTIQDGPGNWDGLQINGYGGLKLVSNIAPVKIYTDGGTTPVMTIINPGNVGIGTTAPPAKLTVDGPGLYPGSIYNNLITVRDTATAAVGVGGGINFVGNYTGVNGDAMLDVGSGIKGVKHGGTTLNDYNWDLAFWTRAGAASANIDERMRILYNGNVGIGTTAPSQKLQVTGDATEPSLLFSDNAIARFTATTNTALVIGTSPTSPYPVWMQVRHDSSGSTAYPLSLQPLGGNVGIGTTGPDTKLQVVGSAKIGAAENQGVWLESTAASDYGSQIYLTSDLGVNQGAVKLSSTDAGFGNAKPNLIISRATNNQVYGLDPSALTYTPSLVIEGVNGNVGIGTTNPLSLLHLQSANSRIYFGGTNDGTGSTGYFVEVLGSSSGDNSGNGRDLTIKAGNTDNAAGKIGGDLYLKGGAPTSPATAYGDVLLATDGGNVGIGTTAPTQGKLVVASGDGTDGLSLVDSTPTNTGAEIQYISFYGSDSSNGVPFASPLAQIGTNSQNGGASIGNLRFYTKPYNSAIAERMRITSDGNVGIGTTGPTEKLEVAGWANFVGASSGIRFTSQASSGTAGTIYRDNDTASLIIQSQTAAGAHNLLLNPTNGNVGIGTVTPGQKLTVFDSTAVGDTAGNTRDLWYLGGKDSGTFDTYLKGQLYRVANGTDWTGVAYILGRGVQNTFATASQSYLSFYGGNIGIGTTNPQAPLEIKSGFGTTALRFGATLGDYHSIVTNFDGGIPTSNYLGFNVEYVSNDTRRVMTLRGDGNVGIGTTDPVSRLDIRNSAAIYTANFYYDLNSNSTGALWLSTGTNNPGSATFKVTDYADNVDFVIMNDGKVGIGTTTPGANFKLDVNGYVRANGEIDLGMQSGVANPRMYIGDSSASGDFAIIDFDSTGNYLNIHNQNTVTGLVIASGGNVGIGTANPTHLIELDADTYGTTAGWVDSSDRNKKENFTKLSNVPLSAVNLGSWTGNGSTIAAVEYGAGANVNLTDTELLSRLSLLPIVQYNFINDGDVNEMNSGDVKHIGPTAQDFYKLFGLGAADTRIKATDMAGIALAGIKALTSKTQENTLNISGLSDNQNKIAEQLTGQLADQSLTLSDKLRIIGENLDALNKEQYAQQIATINEQVADIQSQYLAISELITISDGIYDLNAGILKAAGIDVSGQLEAGGVVAGAFTVKAVEGKPQTIGEAYICPKDSADEKCADQDTANLDGKSITIDTNVGQSSAVTDSAKIFINFENNPEAYSWTEKETNEAGAYTGKFQIRLDKETTTPVKVNWWIVESR